MYIPKLLPKTKATAKATPRATAQDTPKSKAAAILPTPASAPTPAPSTPAPSTTPARQLVCAPAQPTLRFTPYAWAKLNYLRKLASTEICGFGVASNPDDPLLITDFNILPQVCSSVSAEIQEDAISDYFTSMVEKGYQPFQFFRVWLHTHPNMSSSPSGTDIDTFYSTFGRCDWCVMFILGESTQTCQLRFNTGPGGTLPLPFSIDYAQPFPATNHDQWTLDFQANVKEEPAWSTYPASHQASYSLLPSTSYQNSRMKVSQDYEQESQPREETGEETGFTQLDIPTELPNPLRQQLLTLPPDELDEALYSLSFYSPSEYEDLELADLLYSSGSYIY